MITIKNPGKKLQEIKTLVLEVWQRAVVFPVEKLKILNIKIINVLILPSRKTASTSPTHSFIPEIRKRRTSSVSSTLQENAKKS